MSSAALLALVLAIFLWNRNPPDEPTVDRSPPENTSDVTELPEISELAQLVQEMRGLRRDLGEASHKPRATSAAGQADGERTRPVPLLGNYATSLLEEGRNAEALELLRELKSIVRPGDNSADRVLEFLPVLEEELQADRE